MGPVSSRSNNFTFIRLILAASVILFHSFGLLGNYPGEPIYKWTGGQIHMGDLAVDLFLCLSGYLVLASRFTSNLGRFVWKRALRIYPAFLVASIVGLLLVTILVTGASDNTVEAWRNLPLVALRLGRSMIPGAFISDNHMDVNKSLWTIPYEELCYVILIGLWATGFYKRRWLIFVAFFAGYIPMLLNGSDLTHYSSFFQHAPRLWTWFAAGSAIYLYRAELPLTGKIALLAAILTASSLLLGVFWFVAPVLLPYLLFYGALGIPGWFAWLGRVGDFSYGLYIYAWPVQQVLISRIGRDLSPYALSLMTLFAAGVLAIGSWYLIEKPALTLKDFRIRAVNQVAEAA